MREKKDCEQLLWTTKQWWEKVVNKSDTRSLSSMRPMVSASVDAHLWEGMEEGVLWLQTTDKLLTDDI